MTAVPGGKDDRVEQFVVAGGRAARTASWSSHIQVAKRSESACCFSLASRVASGLKTRPPSPSES